MSGRRDDPLLVYSTERGLVCPKCRRPAGRCGCRKDAPAPAGDGVIRVRRETKGRGGKTVTTVSGVPLAGEALRDLASELKRRCGSGGTVKDATIELQGDHRATIVEELTRRGFAAKR